MAESLDPDEVCQVCEATRENHGDKHHVFSQDGQLVPLRPGQPPRRQAPAARGAGVMEAQTTGLVLRLVERLAQKGLLEGPDLMMIFGGTDAPPTGRSADDRASSDSGPQKSRRGGRPDTSE